MDNKKWVYCKHDKESIDKISSLFNISPLVATVILNRGLREAEEIEMYLKNDIRNCFDPFLMKDMDKAVHRIRSAIAQKQKITVYGDYDVDGVTSTAILVDFLTQWGACVDYYIPDRIDEGYGLNNQALEKIYQGGTSVVITVDSGITASKEARYAAELGMDMVITDHHECKDEIPEAYAILNPKQKDCPYPFKDLAGVGVTFKLIQALAGKDMLSTVLDRYCDIVCLGTIADVVPLLGENRIIAGIGLKRMSNTKNIGLRSLLEVSGLKDKNINAGMVGFILAPRINAAGRIGSALKAVQLFLTEDESLAYKIACELDEENRNRQSTEMSILEEALVKINEDDDIKKNKVFVLHGENWHHGVIGIVASKITEQFHRPCILISLEGNEGKGSGRSIRGFNLFEALNKCEADLIKFGGHELAAGLSIAKEKIPLFLYNINQYADQVLQEDDLIPKIYIDCEINTQHLTLNTVKQLEVLEPFGMGNPTPVFALNNSVISQMRAVGNQKHLKLTLEKDNMSIDAIGFNMSNYMQHFIIGDMVDIACSIQMNNFNGLANIQLLIKDIKLSSDKSIEQKYYKSFSSNLSMGAYNHNAKLKDGFGGVSFYYAEIDDLKDRMDAEVKCLIIVNTLPGIKNLLRELQDAELDDKRYSVHYNQVVNSNLIDILVNPNMDLCRLENYAYIYVYDPFFNVDDYYKICHSENRVYLLPYHERFEWCDQVLDSIIPQRQDFVITYQYIKARSPGNIYTDSLELLARRISVSYDVSMNMVKLKHCIDIFEEFGLLKQFFNGDDVSLQLCEHKGGKVNIENSLKLAELRLLKNRVKKCKLLLEKIKTT